MLTLKEPIQLRSCRFAPAVPAAFHEKLLGNYALFGARFGPKELLFLLTAPPELPEDLGGMTALHLHTGVTDARSVTLEVVNHVVNRILLSQSAGFTYQDQVYITTVLQKLGVTDVAQFMGEVRSLWEGERSVSALLRLYREEVRQARSLPAGEVPAAPASKDAPPPEGEAPAAAPRYVLHNNIYRRLQTGAVYAALNAYHQSLVQVSPAAARWSLRLSEELRVSNLLALSELRSQTVQTAAPALSLRLNHYELGDLLPPPQSEGAVLSQAAEAALYATVEHVLVQTLSRSLPAGGVWQDLRASLSQTVENTLRRYEAHHSEAARPAGAGERAGHTLLIDLYREEERLLRTLRELQTSREEPGRTPEAAPAPGRPSEGPARLEHLETVLEGDVSQEITQVTEGHTALFAQDITQITRRLLEAGAPPRPAAPKAVPAGTDMEHRRETRLERRETARTQTLQTLRELARAERELTCLLQEPASVRELRLLAARTGQKGNAAPAPAAAAETSPAAAGDAAPAEGPGPAALLRETPPPRAAAAPEAVPAPRLLHHFQDAAGEAETPLQKPATAPIPAGEVLRRERERLLEQVRESGQPVPAEQGGPPAAASAASGERERVRRILSPAEGEERETLLLRELSRLDRRNWEVTERLRESRTERVLPAAPAAPDRRRTLSDALRAMEAPERVLRELLEQPAAPEGPRTDSERELLLRHTDRATRTLLEQAILYERDPEAAARQGALRPGALGTLNAEGARQQREALELIARLEEPGPVSGGTGGGAGAGAAGPGVAPGVLRPGAAGPSGPEAAAGKRTPLRFVHKQERDALSETLLTRLEEQRRASALRQTAAAEAAARQLAAGIQVNGLPRQPVQETAEDVSALVSRTLARQMETITDRVCQQMEKRLQTERYRRGRF